MYEVSPTQVEKKNGHGKPVGMRKAFQIHDADFPLASVARHEDAEWLAKLINIAIQRDRELRSFRYRFLVWFGNRAIGKLVYRLILWVRSLLIKKLALRPTQVPQP